MASGRWLGLCMLLGVLAASARAQTACSSCHAILRILEDAACDPAAADAVTSFISKNICPQFGDQTQCMQMTEALVPVAIQWLREAATPASMCSAAGVCPPEVLAQPSAFPKLRERRLARQAVKDGVTCSMCEYVVMTVKSEVDDPKTLEEIKEHALQACEVLPQDMAATCKDMVTNYADLFVAMIDSMDPLSSCASIGLCTAKLLSQVKLPALPAPLLNALAPVVAVQGKMAAMGNGNMCDMCRLTVLEAHTLVGNPAIQAQMINYTKALCTSLGDTMKATCESYVDIYAPTVFVALQSYLQPDPICQALSMCDAPPPSSRKGSASRTFLPGAVFKPNSVLVLGGRKSAGGSSGNGGSAGVSGPLPTGDVKAADARDVLLAALRGATLQEQQVMDSLKELDTALVTSRVVPPTKAADAATQTAGADDTSVEEQYPQYEQEGDLYLRPDDDEEEQEQYKYEEGGDHDHDHDHDHDEEEGDEEEEWEWEEDEEEEEEAEKEFGGDNDDDERQDDAEEEGDEEDEEEEEERRDHHHSHRHHDQERPHFDHHAHFDNNDQEEGRGERHHNHRSRGSRKALAF